mmetsp:Transcript_4639/g.7869  ORF Transcript_4639/g.7869 Transcript_4639/m.7869 type:complete len:123 (+) Transcript_4639:64-432(+)
MTKARANILKRHSNNSYQPATQSQPAQFSSQLGKKRIIQQNISPKVKQKQIRSVNSQNSTHMSQTRLSDIQKRIIQYSSSKVGTASSISPSLDSSQFTLVGNWEQSAEFQERAFRHLCTIEE